MVEEAERKNITVTELIRSALQEIIEIQKKTIQWPRPKALGIIDTTRTNHKKALGLIEKIKRKGYINCPSCHRACFEKKPHPFF